MDKRSKFHNLICLKEFSFKIRLLVLISRFSVLLYSYGRASLFRPGVAKIFDWCIRKNEWRKMHVTFLCGSGQTGTFWKRWEYQNTLPSCREICMQVKKQQLEPDMEQWTGSKLWKEYIKAIHGHLLFNIYAKHIMEKAGLYDSQAGIKTSRTNINKLRYADVTNINNLWHADVTT